MTWRLLRALPFAAYNLVPLYGLMYWGWDAFQLLLLYWCETLILAFWTLIRIRFLPVQYLGTIEINGKKTAGTYWNMISFFALHAGAFIFAHLAVLFSLFPRNRPASVEWSVLPDGGWIALLIAFVSGGFIALTGDYRPAFVDRIAASFNTQMRPPPPPPKDNDAVGGLVMGLYARIVLTQCALIFGAWLSTEGATAPLIIIIVVKTLFDLLARVARA
ncbi:hypothetical protein GJW-30_1_02413 [Variibacter gotjawalensis]|uniref:Uncharacterized protein n=1 Tax=Variibacter gotjawalensis TaxID=1333996 RepID=A0A0S3PV88_9BRAD|nr:DUF6498-containing protein [Variibacter gotjawalensis]NIK45700.1 hypothetical protein [Variibacter gotjawalensis]RZS47626.1 hypothetical protein EV661_0016 [Variibacter gotjawalensis]BAT59878.1 hypothetical protein GJW-30_1_02413 [Variibacter gotjawalensis]